MSYTYKRPVWGDWLVTEDGVFFAFTEAARVELSPLPILPCS